MARIRTIKPEAFQHEDLWDLGEETGLPIFQAFVGLFCQADREGRFEWRPRRLKAAILPYWDGDFSRVLDALTTRGFLVRYASGRVEIGCIPTFTDHQVVNARERKSKLPPPPENVQKSDTSTRADACPTRADASPKEGKGREQGREGNEEEPPPTAASETHDHVESLRVPNGWLIHQDWQPSSELVSQIRMRNPGISEDFIRDQLPDFILKYTEAPQREPAWSSKFSKWVPNAWRDHLDPSKADSHEVDPDIQRQLDEIHGVSHGHG